MANNIVINSKFKPFSYAELVQPLGLATEAHQKVEEGLAQLGSQANIWDKLANEEPNSMVASMYNTYSKDLKDKAAMLAKEGLNPSTRQGLMQMRERFYNEITPIENAYKTKAEQVKAQQDARNRDSSIVFDRDAATSSLDDYMKNSSLTYNPLSINEVYATSAKDFSELAKKIQTEGKWEKALGGEYWEQKIRAGYTPEQIAMAVAQDPRAPKEIKDLYQSTMNSYLGRGNWDDKTKALIQDAIDRGASYGVGSVTSKLQSRKAYDYAMQEAMAIRKEKREKPEEPDMPSTWRTVAKVNVNSEIKTKALNKDLTMLSEIMKNPSLLNKVATRFTPEFIQPDPSMQKQQSNVKSSYKPYQELLDNLSKKYGKITYNLVDGKLSDNNLEDIAKKIQHEISTSAIKNFIYKPNITQSDKITQVIKEDVRSYAAATKSTGLYELDNNKKGKPIKLDDITDYFTNDTDISYDPEVGLLINSTKDKQTKSAIIDPQLFDDANGNVSNMLSNINTYLEYGYTTDAQVEIDKLMNYIYGKYNTLAKVQSNTDSKIE